MRLLALFAALVVFALYAQWRHDHPSPGEGPPLGEWLKGLARRDPDTDPDPDPDPDCAAGDDPAGIEGCDCPRCAAWRGWAAGPPPAEPTTKPPSQLDVWIGRSLDNGAKYKDMVREGQALFGAGEATVKRAIRRVREAREAAEAET